MTRHVTSSLLHVALLLWFSRVITDETPPLPISCAKHFSHFVNLHNHTTTSHHEYKIAHNEPNWAELTHGHSTVPGHNSPPHSTGQNIRFCDHRPFCVTTRSDLPQECSDLDRCVIIVHFYFTACSKNCPFCGHSFKHAGTTYTRPSHNSWLMSTASVHLLTTPFCNHNSWQRVTTGDHILVTGQSILWFLSGPLIHHWSQPLFILTAITVHQHYGCAPDNN